MKSTAAPTVSTDQGRFVVHLDVEFGLERGDQFDRLGALGAQIEDEMAVRLDHVLRNAQDVADHFLHALFDFRFFHVGFLLMGLFAQWSGKFTWTGTHGWLVQPCCSHCWTSQQWHPGSWSLTLTQPNPHVGHHVADVGRAGDQRIDVQLRECDRNRRSSWPTRTSDCSMPSMSARAPPRAPSRSWEAFTWRTIRRGGVPIQRGQPERHVLEQLDVDAAQPEHHRRPERRVALAAQNDLVAVGDHPADQESVRFDLGHGLGHVAAHPLERPANRVGGVQVRARRP